MNWQHILASVLAIFIALLGWYGVQLTAVAVDMKDRLNSHCGWHVGKGEIDACKH